MILSDLLCLIALNIGFTPKFPIELLTMIIFHLHNSRVFRLGHVLIITAISLAPFTPIFKQSNFFY